MDISENLVDQEHPAASVEDFDILCHPCNDKGNRAHGIKLCKNCEIYICQQCSKFHRNHVLLEYLFISRLSEIQINVQTTDDKHNCWITGLTYLSPNKLLLADRDNDCIKCVDTTNRAIISSVQLPSYPWDITTLVTDQAVATLPFDKKLQNITTNGGLKLVLSACIEVNGECMGIDFTGDKLVVSFRNPGSVEILDLDGTVLHHVCDHSTTNLLFSWPLSLCIAKEIDQEVIYVSDYKLNSITKLSISGQVLETNECSSGCQGITATDDGQVIVCGNLSEDVVVVSPDLKNFSILISGVSPIAVLYCGTQQKIYLSCKDDNSLHAYDLT